jgi:sulfur carrier protein
MTTSTRSIIINGELYEFAAGSVRDLLELRGIDPARPGVAVAVNDRVVRRGDWSATTLDDGDRIEIITAMQGG